MEVIALDLVVSAGIDLGRQETDIADRVLGAGIGAAGKIDVERHVEREPRVEILDQRQPVPLGVGEREFAADIAGAGDEPGAHRAGLGHQAERLDLRREPPATSSRGTSEISRLCQTVNRSVPEP